MKMPIFKTSDIWWLIGIVALILLGIILLDATNSLVDIYLRTIR